MSDPRQMWTTSQVSVLVMPSTNWILLTTVRATSSIVEPDTLTIAS